MPLSRFFAFWVIAVGGCALDLATKQWVFGWLGMPRERSEWWIWEPYFGLQTALNLGAVFGVGAGYGRFFALLSIVAAIGILFWLFYAGGARDWRLTVALGCIMAGIAGNLYDRLGLWADAGVPMDLRSGVRDWILLRYGTLTWPNFNVADSLLVCGAAILILQAMCGHSGDSPAARNAAPV
jgi:signal peptidase II